MSWGEENLIRTELNQAQRRLEIEKRQMNAKKICEMCDAWNEDNEKSKCFIKHCQHIIDNFCLHASIFRYWSNEISLRAGCFVCLIDVLSSKLPAAHYKIVCFSHPWRKVMRRRKTLFHSQFHFTVQAIVVVVISVTLVVSDKYCHFSPQQTHSLEIEVGDEMCELLENNKRQKAELHRRWKDGFHFIFEQELE